jgi:hypothetical protein
VSASSAPRCIVHCEHADEGDPQFQEMLQETIELRLITNGTHEDRVAVLVDDAHGRKGSTHQITEVPLDFESIRSTSAHHSYVCTTSRDVTRFGFDHLGECIPLRIPMPSALATASSREPTRSLRYIDRTCDLTVFGERNS